MSDRPDLEIVERSVVRMVLKDSADCILLFHTHEVTAPEHGEWWELPGGGIDRGETYLDAAIRETREETGIVVSPPQVGRPTWRRIGSFRHRNVRHMQHEVVVAVTLDAPGPAIDERERFDYEKEDYFGFRWWPIIDIVKSTELFYPRSLPRLLTRFLAGEEIDEPQIEFWS